MTKKPRIFYRKSKVSKMNETALQAVKRAKAVDTIEKQIKKGRNLLTFFGLIVVDIFVIVVLSG